MAVACRVNYQWIESQIRDYEKSMKCFSNPVIKEFYARKIEFYKRMIADASIKND